GVREKVHGGGLVERLGEDRRILGGHHFRIVVTGRGRSLVVSDRRALRHVGAPCVAEWQGEPAAVRRGSRCLRLRRQVGGCGGPLQPEQHTHCPQADDGEDRRSPEGGGACCPLAFGLAGRARLFLALAPRHVGATARRSLFGLRRILHAGLGGRGRRAARPALALLLPVGHGVVLGELERGAGFGGFARVVTALGGRERVLA